MKDDDFELCLKTGKASEQKFYNYLYELNLQNEFTDLTNDNIPGADYISNFDLFDFNYSKFNFSYDVKTLYQSDGYPDTLFVEIMQNAKTNSEGWISLNNTDYIIGVANNYIAVFDFQDLRNLSNFWQENGVKPSKSINYGNESLCYRVPIDFINQTKYQNFNNSSMIINKYQVENIAKFDLGYQVERTISEFILNDDGGVSGIIGNNEVLTILDYNNRYKIGSKII